LTLNKDFQGERKKERKKEREKERKKEKRGEGESEREREEREEREREWQSADIKNISPYLLPPSSPAADHLLAAASRLCRPEL